MKFFETSELRPSHTPDVGEVGSSRTTFDVQQTKKVSALKDLCGYLPTPGEIIFLFTSTAFNSVSFVLYIIQNIGRIEDLSFSTYSISKRAIDLLCKLMDNNTLESITIYLSESFQIRSPDKVAYLQELSSSRNISILYGRNHSKIMCIRTNNDYFVVEGSGNFSNNSLNEQYIFLNEKTVYDYRISCIIQH